MILRLLPVRVAAGAALVAAGAVATGTTPASASPPVAAAPAASSCATLPASFGYNEFSAGNVTVTTGESDGPAAFGGTTTVSNYSIAKMQSQVPSSNISFVAGGPVNGGGSSSVKYGNGFYDSTLTGLTAPNGTLSAVSASNLPVNFAQTATADANFSSTLAALPTSPGDLSGMSGTTLTLTATQTEGNGDYVWDLTAGEIAPLTGIKVVFNTGITPGTVIVNIPDSGALSLGLGLITLNGQSAAGTPTTGGSAPALASSTVFNFPAATSVDISNGAWAGTLLVPNGNLSAESGHVWGSVIAASLSGSNVGVFGPTGAAVCLASPTVSAPQGRPLFLALGGLAVVGGAMILAARRRRSVPVA